MVKGRGKVPHGYFAMLNDVDLDDLKLLDFAIWKICYVMHIIGY